MQLRGRRGSFHVRLRRPFLVVATVEQPLAYALLAFNLSIPSTLLDFTLQLKVDQSSPQASFILFPIFTIAYAHTWNITSSAVHCRAYVMLTASLHERHRPHIVADLLMSDINYSEQEFEEEGEDSFAN